MAKYISNRQQNLKIGIVSYTEDKTVLEVTGNVGIKTADTQGYELYVNGDANISGIVSASSFRGDGSQLTGITATSSLLISANTDNQSQYLTYVTGTGSTTGFGITTTGLVFNPSTGNLGIGTTNPTSKLHVVGNVYVSGIATLTQISAGGTVGTAGSILSSTGSGLSWIPAAPAGAITGITVRDSNNTIVGTSGSVTQLTFSTGFGVTGTTGVAGIATITLSSNIVGTSLSISGITTLGVTSTTNLTSQTLNVSGISTFTNGPVLIGGGTSTGTAGQVLQVSGINSSVYIGGSVGLGTTNPTSKLHVIGNVRVSGVVTATTFVGALTGTATSTTNIPNLTGAITSVGTATTLGSFSSAQLATALTDETGSGANVFATSPVLVTPSLGIATATSINASGIITATQLSTGASGTGVNITTNTISGPATLTIDPAAVGDNTGAVRIKGDLYVDGTQFIVNSTTIELADFNVGIATTVGTNALLDGAGIGIGSTGIRKTLTWSNSSTALKSSEDFDVASGKVYKINGTSVLSNNTLGSGVVTSSLTSVGTLTNLNVGNINSTGIITATTFVGALTGTATSISGGLAGNVVYQSTPNATAFLANGTSGFVLQSNGVGNAPTWVAAAPSGAVSGITVRDSNSNLVGTSGSITQLTFGTGLSVTGTTGAAGIATIRIADNIVGTSLSISGISTFTNGPILVGTATSTGTASQPLQVTGGAYVSGSVGIGTTNPGEKLQVDGNIRVGISTTSNYIAFRGTTGDSSGTYNHTYIGERIWGGTESSELLLFKGNDFNTAVGPDRIRLAASQVRIDTYTTATSGTFEGVGISTTLINRVVVHSTGEVGIGTDVLTGTASQQLQVDSGAYVSGNLGVGTTNPTSKLHVIGDARITGVVTATTFIGALTGTATSTTNIPNLTGAITSVNTTTSLGSFTSAQLATALTDETGSGANVFATSPTLVTPVLGAATATSIVVGSGVTINASGISAAAGIITASQLSTGASGTGVNITTNTISGPATLTIDPAAVGDNTGAVRIKGDLYVDGTQFIVNSTTIELADFNVGIATTVGTNALLDGAGIGIGSTSIRKTLTWSNSSTALKSSEDFDVASGKVYKIAGTSVLSNNTLGSGVVTSSLTSVGTLGQLQVTGVSTFTNGPILVGTATSTGTASQVLQVNGGAYVSGSVGIGTASPAFTADIAGDARVTSTNKMRFGGTAGTTNFYIQYNSTANSLDFVAG